jgi:MFS family permease
VSLIALRHRNFRLLWIGLLLSFTGTFMQNAALLWHVSILVPPEDRGIALGLVGLAKVVPIVVFSLVSGVVADAWSRRRLMLVTQTGGALVALALAVLTFRGLAVVWPLYLLAGLGAAVGAFDLPARQALLPMLVPRDHLPNAISLNAIMIQIASVVGPSLGGLLIASFGLGWTYLVNSVSFGCVIVALTLMRNVKDRPADAASGREAVSLRAALEGVRFVFQSPLIRSTMLLDFVATFFASATALLPIFAQDILHVGPRGFGWLYAAPAVGSVISSVAMVPMTDRIVRRGRTLLWAVAGHGVATAVFGLSRAFWLTFVCLALTGATDTVSTVIRSIVRQLETPERLLGRMSGVNMVFFMGGPQLGELEAGVVAHLAGAPFSVVSGGIACAFVTAWVAANTPLLRRYRREAATPLPEPPIGDAGRVAPSAADGAR